MNERAGAPAASNKPIRTGEHASWFILAIVPRQLVPRQLAARQLAARQLAARQLAARQITKQAEQLGAVGLSESSVFFAGEERVARFCDFAQSGRATPRIVFRVNRYFAQRLKKSPQRGVQVSRFAWFDHRIRASRGACNAPTVRYRKWWLDLKAQSVRAGRFPGVGIRGAELFGIESCAATKLLLVMDGQLQRLAQRARP
jgi:hypothetical protein